MRKIFFLTVMTLMAIACSDVRTAQCGRHGMIDEDGWFSVQDITPEGSVGNVWLISEYGAATCYLVTGSKYAMLIDTGIGVGNLSGLVSDITDLPLIVVNTHGHPDHVGANYQFAEVWVPEKDKDVLESMNPLNTPDLEAYVASNAGEFKYDIEKAKANIEDIKGYAANDVIFFDEGQSWDLGDKVITTLELGGHTPGSMMFLDEADDMVFSGDAMNGYLWMWLDHCLTVEEYEANLASVLPQISSFGHIFGGHEVRPQGMEPAQAARMLDDVRNVLAGKVTPVVTPKPMGGEGTVNVYYFDTWLLWAR